MVELASLYGVKACAGQSGEAGVWVEDRMVGATRVHIAHGITSHGLIGFQIGGIVNEEVASLRRETGILLPADEVIHEQVITCSARVFGYTDITWKENPLTLEGKSQ